MFQIFTLFANWLTYQVLGLSTESHWGEAIQFFIEDSTKILVLLIVMIYVIAIFRASLNVEAVRCYLMGKGRFSGYFLGSFFGVITPFCSCSSIPLFLGFTSAGIPLGITMAFLITSPLINEIAIILLFSLLGLKFTLIYMMIGILMGVLNGWLLDSINAQRWLKPFVLNALNKNKDQKIVQSSSKQPSKMSILARHQFAKQEMLTILKRVWKWIFIGVGIGATLHGFVPQGWIEAHLGNGEWWSVPAAVVMGIPLYANATGIIPIMESLLANGLPIGTTLAFCMSTVAASMPEFIMLKQVMEWRLLATLFALLLCAFTFMGWILNFSIWSF